MADQKRTRMVSQSSTSSTDSSMLDDIEAGYAVVESSRSTLLSSTAYADKGSKPVSHSRRLAFASLCVSVFCLVALLAGCTCFVYFKVGDAPAAFVGEPVCMPCGQISPNPLTEPEAMPDLQHLDVHTDEADGDTEICCARTPAQYAVLFKLILRRQEEVKKLSDIFGPGGDTTGKDSPVASVGGSAVSAHLLTKPMSPEYTDEGGHRMQQWKSPKESPLSHVKKGLTFHDNKIYVQTEGLYFIYCQILFNRHDPHPEDDREPPKLASHYVRRHSLQYPASTGILLKARHTRVSGNDDRHSSYVGGLFFLHAGDQIFVQVSVPELVSYDDRASFFGLFRVGN